MTKFDLTLTRCTICIYLIQNFNYIKKHLIDVNVYKYIIFCRFLTVIYLFGIINYYSNLIKVHKRYYNFIILNTKKKYIYR